MIRIVTVFSGAEADEKISSVLERSGLPVRSHCRTGAEAIRAIRKMGGGTVVCGFKFADMTADELAFELKGEALLLVIAKSAQLELCENEELFTMPLPIKAGELAGSVEMLVQLDQKRSSRMLPRRSEGERELIEQAKALLMERSGMTEERAHRYIQRRSMDCGAKMADTARLILRTME